MTAPLFILVLGLLLSSCAMNDSNNSGEIDTSGRVTLRMFDTLSNSLKPSKEKKLLETFFSFRTAILKRDLNTLRSLSTKCISCSNCEGSDLFISADSFYNVYYKTVFNSNLHIRLINDKYFNGHYDEGNWHIYSEPCIFKASDIPNPKIAEIAVKLIDPSFDGEGAEALLAFIETRTGYKFCGYSTIP